jgi:hypothetical protein
MVSNSSCEVTSASNPDLTSTYCNSMQNQAAVLQVHKDDSPPQPIFFPSIKYVFRNSARTAPSDNERIFSMDIRRGAGLAQAAVKPKEVAVEAAQGEWTQDNGIVFRDAGRDRIRDEIGKADRGGLKSVRSPQNLKLALKKQQCPVVLCFTG